MNFITTSTPNFHNSHCIFAIIGIILIIYNNDNNNNDNNNDYIIIKKKDCMLF